jgi:hypothetical protein
MDSYVKRPSDSLSIEFDVRTFVAAVVAAGGQSSAIEFNVRQEPGITVTSEMPEVGLVRCTVLGGNAGRVYRVALEAVAADGDSTVDQTVVRVRDASVFGLLGLDTEAAVGGDVVVDPAGDRLVDPAVSTDFITAL